MFYENMKKNTLIRRYDVEDTISSFFFIIYIESIGTLSTYSGKGIASTQSPLKFALVVGEFTYTYREFVESNEPFFSNHLQN